MNTEKEPAIKGVFLSLNDDNGKEAMIGTIRLHLPYDDPAELALRGCAYWIRQPEGEIKHPNTVLVGGGRETSHDNLRLASWQLIGGFLNAFENPNVVAGFYTYSGWFVPRSVAMWCSRHIEGGLKPDWSKRSAFTKLQSPGVVWDAHKKEWQAYQRTLVK